jgi:dTDP-L-rhamnose 4-epimerase
MAERVLITGGAGFIGSRLANHLASQGHSVVVVDNLSSQVHSIDRKFAIDNLALKPEVEFVLGDIMDSDLMHRTISGVDSIYHLAAETGTGQSMYEIGKYTKVNVTGTGMLLDVISSSKVDVKRIILTSSRAVYGEGKYFCQNHGNKFPKSRNIEDVSAGIFEPKCDECSGALIPRPTDEDANLNPNSVYGITKLSQEQLVINYGHSRDIPTFAFRLQNVYGPGQSLINPYTGIISIFSTRIMNGGRIQLFEDGSMTRDFAYIDDVVKMISKPIEMEIKESGSINIGSSTSTSVASLLDALQDKIGKRVEVTTTGSFRIGDIRHNTADMSKFNRIFGEYRPTPLEIGLDQFINWANSQPRGIDEYEKSLKELINKRILK